MPVEKQTLVKYHQILCQIKTTVLHVKINHASLTIDEEFLHLLKVMKQDVQPQLHL